MLGRCWLHLSLFISDLAFTNPETVEATKIGILVASSIAGASGLLILFLTLPRRDDEGSSDV